MATATNDKPLRLGDLPVVKTNILENAREFDKGVVGGYNGIFPLTAASQGGIYLLPSTGKFYVCETDYNGAQISAPNSNFVELSVWKNHDRLSNLSDKFVFGSTRAYSISNTGGVQLSFDKSIEFAIGTHNGDDPQINIITAHEFSNFSQGKVGFKSDYKDSCGCYYFIKFK